MLVEHAAHPLDGMQVSVSVEEAGNHSFEHLVLHRFGTGSVLPRPVGYRTKPQTRGPRIHLPAGNVVDQSVGAGPGDVDAALTFRAPT